MDGAEGMEAVTDLAALAAEVLALAETATPGPWSESFDDAGSDILDGRPRCVARVDYRHNLNDENDAAFIAHARTYAPALARYVATVWPLIEALRAAAVAHGPMECWRGDADIKLGESVDALLAATEKP